jgi:hypothetical protein
MFIKYMIIFYWTCMVFVLLPFGGLLLKINFFQKKESKKVIAEDLISESKQNDNGSGVFSDQGYRQGSIGTDLFVEDTSSSKK